MKIPLGIRTLTAAAGLLVATLALGACGASTSEKASDDSEKATASTNKTAEGELSDCSTLSTESSAEETEETQDSQSESARSQGTSPFEATGPIATIGDREVPASFFNDEVANRPRLQRIPPGAAGRFKKKLVRKAVDQNLIETELDRSSATVSRKAVREKYTSVRERFPDKKTFESFLQRRGLSEADLRVKICRDVKLKAHIRENYDVGVTDEDIESHYEANKKRFSQPEQVKASHILIKVGEDASDEKVKEAKTKAETLVEKASQSETDFAKLAKEESEGPSAERGGALGYFARKRMVPAFSKAAFDAEPGTIVGPVRTRFGFHVIKVHDKRAATTKSLEEVRDSIEQKLASRRMKRSVQQYLQTLRDKHSIEYHYDNVEVRARKGSAGSKMRKKKLRRKLKKKLEQRQRRRSGESSPDENEKGAESETEDRKPESEGGDPSGEAQ